jgi:hypothetical protein
MQPIHSQLLHAARVARRSGYAFRAQPGANLDVSTDQTTRSTGWAASHRCQARQNSAMKGFRAFDWIGLESRSPRPARKTSLFDAPAYPAGSDEKARSVVALSRVPRLAGFTGSPPAAGPRRRVTGLLSGSPPTGTRPQARAKLGTFTVHGSSHIASMRSHVGPRGRSTKCALPPPQCESAFFAGEWQLLRGNKRRPGRHCKSCRHLPEELPGIPRRDFGTVFIEQDASLGIAQQPRRHIGGSIIDPVHHLDGVDASVSLAHVSPVATIEQRKVPDFP